MVALPRPGAVSLRASARPLLASGSSSVGEGDAVTLEDCCEDERDTEVFAEQWAGEGTAGPGGAQAAAGRGQAVSVGGT